MTAVDPSAAARRMVPLLDVGSEAYALGAAAVPERTAPVSRAVVRALAAVVLGTGGRVVPGRAGGAVRLEYAPAGQGAGRRVLRAVPCARPPRTAECGRCGHWETEHDHPAIVSACDRYLLRIGPARFKTAEHGGVTYAWVRRMGRARWVFELAEPCEAFPGGTLTVHRYPGPDDGGTRLAAHCWPVAPERRAGVLKRARERVR
ncbi:hypothetical protein AB0G49_14245 [Streptomyces longwoodensis]|uniref:hypothetical protein n=1 Tax=Streptomyces longwoodensis TaxID=68231 RepID=UPI003401D960